jgi:hypothetical protein
MDSAVAAPWIVHALHQVKPVPKTKDRGVFRHGLIEVPLEPVSVALDAVEVDVGQHQKVDGVGALPDVARGPRGRPVLL